MRTEVKFGRTDENDIVADHQSVSRAHADSCSTKAVEGHRQQERERRARERGRVRDLQPEAGDVVELGHLKFRFCGPGEKFSPPPEKGEDGAQKAASGRPLLS